MTANIEKLSDTDSYNPETIECPWKYDALLREEAPVYYDEANDMYLVSSHELVHEVLHKPEVFSSRYMEKMLSKEPFPMEILQIYAKGFEIREALLVSDGAVHDRHRHIATKAFSRQRLEELMPLLHDHATRLIDEALKNGEMEFRSAIAKPLPLNTLQQQLRIPDEDMHRAVEWSEILESGFSGVEKSMERLRYEAEQTVECQHYFAAKIEKEMQQIRDTGKGYREDDIITMLAQMIVDEANPMDMHEAISFLVNLFPATNGTTTASMMACMHRFTDNPDVQKRIAEDPSLINKLLEETFRHEAPARAFWRRSTEETELGGVTIPKDKWILLRVSAANRDSCVYANADKFDVDRPRAKPNFNFSSGIHICAGRNFARSIIGDVIEQLCQRAENFRFVEGKNDFSHTPNMLATGYKELHIAFDVKPTSSSD